MNIKKTFLILSLVGFTAGSSYAMAQNYVFRSLSQGVKASGSLVFDEDIVDEGEDSVACYDPSSIGKVGTEGECLDMLIVNRAMLDQGVNNNYSIVYDGQTYTFANGGGNIFTGQVDDFSRLFYESSFNGDIGYWNTSSVTDMKGMFLNASAFNQDIGGWNTSKVTLINAVFSGASAFNQDIGRWNTSKIRHMGSMFYGASAFNQDLSKWDTSKVIWMAYMFNGASAFNQNISQWDTSKVANMGYMFYRASAFNQDIGDWDTSKVTDMSSMFREASSFNQDIGRWNTSSLTNIIYMFREASEFNHDISQWCVSGVDEHQSFSTGSSMPTNYLPAWGTCPRGE